MDRIGRALALSVAFVAIFGAFGGLVWNVGHATLGVGGLSISLCGSSSPDDVVLRAYLETRAEQLRSPAGSDDTPVPFVVQQGETAGGIAERLEREGLIADAELFRRYVQYHDLDGGIEAGEFTLRQTMTIPEIAEALQDGQRPEQMVAIPEGLRLEQVAAEAAEQTTISEDAFLELVTTGWRQEGYGYSFLAELPPTATLEGFLFPDTYRLPQDPAPSDLVERMLSTFEERVTAQIQADAAGRGLSLYELVTLASIVEREAVVAEERSVIAGVFWNRLQAGWSLEACPTVQYGMGSPDEWWPVISTTDLGFDSPYNTYQNGGLPPGPICSPGLASIRAAAEPADTDYYFFLVDCTKDDGSHLFAETETEHYANYERCGGQIP
ncbi:MAG: endolytic transglycosylase MltG [Chloroflexota bacterium]|nr:endolytic transglycosylase MltG [Chloroflexota bacterium]